MNNKKLQFPVCKSLPNNIKNEMKKDTLASIKDKFERGFRICSSSDQLDKIDNTNTVMLDKCVGTESCLKITGECPPDKKQISFFHTHPKSHLTYPSLGDILHADMNDYKFLCIGGKDNDKPIVRCMPLDVPIVTPQTQRIELDWFIEKWKERVNDCIIDI